MPTYEYRCDTCGRQIEVIQSFTDPALTQCPHCESGTLRKLFGNVGVVFKGSGFYRNDARADAKKAAKAGAGSGDSTEKADSGSGADKSKQDSGSAPSSPPSSSGDAKSSAAPKETPGGGPSPAKKAPAPSQ